MHALDPADDVTSACVVLGGSTHSTLSAVRSIARLGLPTYAGVLQRQAVKTLAASRSCIAVRRISGSSPESVTSELLKFAIDEFPTATRVLVISTSDRLIDHLDSGRELLDPRFDLVTPPGELCGALLDKVESMKLAEAAGLQVPPWTSVTAVEDLGSLPELLFPVCVRPTSWSTTGTSSFKIAVCATPTELEDCLRSALEGGGAFIVQEYVGDADGLDVGMIWVSQDGSQKATWTGVKRRSSSAKGGVLAWGETVSLPDVESALDDFVSTTKYRGVGGIEFLRSGSDLWFIEFNPRLEAFHRLAALSGLDGPALLATEWLYGNGPDEGRSDESSRSAALWVGSAWLQRITGDPKGILIFLTDGLRFLNHRKRTYSIWSRTDPMPGIVTAIEWVLRPLKSLAGRGIRSRR